MNGDWLAYHFEGFGGGIDGDEGAVVDGEN